MKMDISDAIDCYTTGSAYNEFREDFKGRLMPGYAVDLAVLDRDIFEIDPGADKGRKSRYDHDKRRGCLYKTVESE